MTADSILDRFQEDAVVMFVGAHPDDETTVSPLLAYAVDCCRQVFVVSLTRGESGWNLHKEDLTRTLAQVREAELRAATKVLGCTPVLFDYINSRTRAHPDGLAVLDCEKEAAVRWHSEGARDTSIQAICERWVRQGGDPVARLVQLFQDKQPVAVLAFEPDKGFTNHEEHKAMAQVVLKALGEYNQSAQSAASKAALYYVHNPSDTAPGAERIMTESLNTAGGKDYSRIANESQACYESQFGTRSSELQARYHDEWHGQQLIQFAGMP